MINEKLIIDVGMHKGEDAIHYLKQGYNVIGIEANPILVEEAKLKYKKYVDSKQLTIVNIGIAKEEGILTFYKNRRLTEWSSFDKELGTRLNTKADEVEIKCITTAQLLEKYGVPYYLKIDIEGYDFICVDGLPNDKELPTYISCEASDLRNLDVLYERGYKHFKIINQLNGFLFIDNELEAKKWYPKYQIIKNGIKLRLQKIINFKHPYGSAGPFGENADGKWVNYNEAKKLFLEFYQNDLNVPLNGISWFDFHAKK